MRLTSVLLVGLLVCSRAAGAECILLTKASDALRPNISVAFAGVVKHVTPIRSEWGGQTVTFDVERIWKGDPS